MTLFGAMNYFLEQRNISNSNKSETDTLNAISLQFYGAKLRLHPFFSSGKFVGELIFAIRPTGKNLIFFMLNWQTQKS